MLSDYHVSSSLSFRLLLPLLYPKGRPGMSDCCGGGWWNVGALGWEVGVGVNVMESDYHVSFSPSFRLLLLLFLYPEGRPGIGDV